MWFPFSLLALLFWSGSDLFSKIGCADSKDKYSHLKMVMAVGTVMGLHALFEITAGNTEISWDILLKYLPVSVLYIASMAIGYFGLRYIELSISSPLCNSSGAIVAALSLIVYGVSDEFPPLSLVAVVLVSLGVIFLGFIEATEDDALREERQKEGNYKYTKSAFALVIPLVYCILDALGTFADSIVLESINEDSANVAYELTFFICGIVSAIYVIGIKKQKMVIHQEIPKYAGACCETAGQYFYIHALADSAHVAFSAPLISTYCAVSVLWGRIFLREKLSKKHYASIALVIVGIIILGVLDI